ncbi:MAG: hypothetical protein JWO59_2216 [Chloroflexi bacterium]|nr:hypothetical protein [Chloroflexota bacterium]
MQTIQLNELMIRETAVIHADWQAETCHDLGTALVCAALIPKTEVWRP